MKHILNREDNVPEAPEAYNKDDWNELEKREVGYVFDLTCVPEPTSKKKKSVTWEESTLKLLGYAPPVEKESVPQEPVEICVEVAPEPSFVGYKRKWMPEDYWEI